MSAIESIGRGERVSQDPAEPGPDAPRSPVGARATVEVRRALAGHSPGWRVSTYAVVALTFFVQGSLVWTDVGGPVTAPLSAAARVGQDLWRSNNCESCHQLYGMGGFLGPDLTNVARRSSAEQTDGMLARGRGLMPNFGLGAADRAALMAFFREVDATGQGSLVLTAPAALSVSVERVGASAAPLPPAVARGLAKLDAVGCESCHRSLRDGGALGAPDLSRAIERRGLAGVRQVLREGRRSMPRLGLAANEVEDVSALLVWVGAHRAALAALPPARRAVAAVPWFSYASPQ